MFKVGDIVAHKATVNHTVQIVQIIFIDEVKYYVKKYGNDKFSNISISKAADVERDYYIPTWHIGDKFNYNNKVATIVDTQKGNDDQIYHIISYESNAIKKLGLKYTEVTHINEKDISLRQIIKEETTNNV